MRKTRIFLGILLIMALMAFVGCGVNDDTTVDPDTPGDVTDNRDLTDDADRAMDNAGEDVENAVDKAGEDVKDLVTTDSAVDKTDNNL